MIVLGNAMSKLNNKEPYKARISNMHQKLRELQETDLETQEIRAT